MESELGVSFIIVNYNGVKYLNDLVVSVFKNMENQPYPFEILFIDNNSTDGSKEVLENLMLEYENIYVYFSNSNLGFGKANNLLVQKSRYQTLMLLNNDTKVLRINNILDRISKVDLKKEIITCKLLNEDETKQKNIFTLKFNIFWLVINLFLIKNVLKSLFKITGDKLDLDKSYFSGCFLVMNKRLYLSVGGFDERYHFYQEEADLFLRLSKFNVTKTYMNNDKIMHYGGGGGLISEFAFINYFISLFILYKLHSPTISKKLIKPIFITGFKFRILLLKMGFNIPYSPFYKTYSTEEYSKKRSVSEIVALHENTLKEIRQFEL